MKLRKFKIIVSIILAGGLLAPDASFSASVYKWQTPDGERHIGDVIPPADVKYGYTVINMVSGEKTVIPRELTPEEIKEKNELEAKKKNEQQQVEYKQQIQEQSDAAFLARYSSLEDIQRGMKKAMDLNQNAIDMLKRKINSLTDSDHHGNSSQIMASYQKEMLDLQVDRLAIPDEFKEKEKRMNRLLH